MSGSYTLVLLRHGESEWNRLNLFTGWEDVALSERGVEEARAAGVYLAGAGLAPDVVHTSVLKRAIDTADLSLAELGRQWIPVRRSWRLNERHYGALTGLDKAETLALYGEEQFLAWRRGYRTPPEPVDRASPFHPINDPRYAELTDDVLPATECLADVVDRMLPWWHDAIVPDLRAGRVVLVSAHGNSLRALVKHLDGIPDDEITALNIPTGYPLVYELDAGLRPVSSRYLPDDETAAAAAAAVASQGRPTQA